MHRTFREVALCHLPDDEIGLIQELINRGMTSAYKSDSGFFIWTHGQWIKGTAPFLISILNQNQDVDYVLFDMDVEPDENLEIFFDS